MKRRNFLTGLGLTIGLNKANYFSKNTRDKTIIKPVHLQIGDTIGLISPAGNIKPDDINNMKTLLINQGFKFKLGKHIFDQYGYLAGKDQDRVNDVHNMFRDDQVKAILTIRGGWGCNRILPLLDFNLIRKNPKIIMGYSDITALLLAIYSQTGLITFHGAVATSTWSDFTINYVNNLLLKREIITWKNPDDTPVETIRSGIAKGQIMGGNLSVLTSMIGSKYLPNWQNKILFVEEIGEDVYRIDRMLTQLKLAGILSQIKGFIFTQCRQCFTPNDPDPTLSLQQVLNDHVLPLNIPAWYGSMMGHIKNQFTIPLGLDVEINADLGTIKMLSSSVI